MELLNWVKSNQLQDIAQWLESSALNDDEKRSWLTNGLGGVTTLHWASSAGNEEIVGLLLSKYPDLVNRTEAEGASALHWAAGEGHTKVVEKLLAVAGAIQTSQRLVNIQDVEGFTALHLAAMAGHTGVVNALLLHGVNLAAVTRSGQTVLHLAVCNGHLAVTALILDRPDASVVLNIRDAQGKLPLDLAYATKNQLMIDYFDSGKRATHLKVQQLEDTVRDLQREVQQLSEDKQQGIVRHSTLFKEHLTLTETLQQRTVQYEQQLIEQQRVISVLSGEKSGLVEQVQLLTARVQQLEQQVQHSPEQMSVEPGHVSELRNMKEKVGMAHSALTNLQRLLEVTQSAMLDTKTQLATVTDLLH